MSGKKQSRHDLKKPDEFVSLFSQVIDWVRGNIAVAGIAVGAVLLGSVGAIAYVQHGNSRSDEAAYKYGKAVTEFHKAMAKSGEERNAALETSLANLQVAYDSNPGSRAGAFSILSIGQANFELSKYEQAANAFEKASQVFEDEPNFRAMALVGAGKSWEATRAYDKALDAYQKANAIDGNPYAEVLKGDIGRLKVYKEQRDRFEAAKAAAAKPISGATDDGQAQ